MRLFLLRHGEAGYNAPSDRLRPLTLKGIRELDSMLGGVSEAHQISQVFHSPYLRTTQTAERVAAFQKAELTALDLLTPESSPQSVIDRLSELAMEQDLDNLLLVTHQPLIGYLTCLFTEGHLRHSEPLLPGQLVELELDFPAAGLAHLVKIWHA